MAHSSYELLPYTEPLSASQSLIALTGEAPVVLFRTLACAPCGQTASTTFKSLSGTPAWSDSEKPLQVGSPSSAASSSIPAVLVFIFYLFILPLLRRRR